MVPYLADADFTLYQGDALDVLRGLPDESVHMCVTSPPFYGLRDYGTGRWEGGDSECDHKSSRTGSPEQAAEQQRRKAERGYASGSNFANYGDRWTDGSVYRDVCGKCGARRVDLQIGLEPSPEEWCAKLVAVFREVRRVLRADGTCWVEVGDSYNSRLDGSHGGWNGSTPEPQRTKNEGAAGVRRTLSTVKPKDLIGAPWMLAFALRAGFSTCSTCSLELRTDLWPVWNGHRVCIDCIRAGERDSKIILSEPGWYLRSDIVWSRPNPMPESVTDRPTKAHSYVFLLSKSARYFFDQEAVREPLLSGAKIAEGGWDGQSGGLHNGRAGGKRDGGVTHPSGRNVRSVWEIPTQPYPEAHFATYPEELVRRCVLAGSSERGCCPECGAPWVRETSVEYDDEGRTTNGPRSLEQRHETAGFAQRLVKSTSTVGWRSSCDHDHAPTPCTVLDPFAGSGTTALVARKHGRRSIGIELSAEYCGLAARRLSQQSLFAEGATA